MDKIQLLGLTPEELERFVTGDLGESKFRASQIAQWLNRGADIGQMTICAGIHLPQQHRRKQPAVFFIYAGDGQATGGGSDTVWPHEWALSEALGNAISIGGDSDTLGCITGSIAEAFFGIPKEIYDKGLEYLTPHFKNVVREFEEKYGNKVI